MKCFRPQAALFVLLLAWACNLRAESLREAATNWPGLKIGSAVQPAMLATPAYAGTLRWQYSLSSPENDLKWAALRTQEYYYSWANADTTLQFDAAAGLAARGHTLMWYLSIPGWLTTGGYTTNQIRNYLFHHIDTVVGRYRGTTFCWDVVNEAFTSSGQIRTTNFWYDNPGIGDFNPANSTLYIEDAFRRANAADPGARLIYNDYSTETANAKSDAIYAMAQDFVSRGVPLHGIGFQMHVSEGGFNYSSMLANFERFNNLGLDLQITEMSVPIPETNGVASPVDLAAQAEVYWNVMSMALSQPHFTVFQTWGFTDASDNGYTGGFPFDQNYQKKPAYWALWNALANQAEKLPVLDVSSGDTTGAFAQDTLSAGAGLQLAANGINDYMTLGVAVPFPGQWDVKIGCRQSGASGKFQTAIAASNSPAFANLGGVVDAYSAGIGAGVTDLGSATFTNAGTWKFRFTVTGTNVNTTGYHITIDYIRITPLAYTNTPPTISNVADQSVNENTIAGPYSFNIGDVETPAGSLAVQAVSLNTNLLPSANIVLGGANSSRTVTLTPATNQSGSAGVLLLVGDGTNQTPETFTLNVKPVNMPPATLGTNLTVITNTSVDLDLRPLVSDIETPVAGIFFAATNPAGGLISLLGDGHTARFSATNHLGAASFNYVATDQGPDPRWLLYYNFETPNQAADKRVTDSSVYGLTGAIEDYGGGSSVYDTSVPAALTASSTQSLSLTAVGDGNGARLATLLPASTYNLANADWTFATWFRHTTIPNTTNVDFILYTGAGDAFGGTGDELCLYINSSSQIQLQHFNTGNTQDVSITSGTIPAGAWHHVAVVFTRTNSNAGQLGLYLDGVKVGNLAPVNWQLDQTDPLVFGGVTLDRQSRWFTGNLDDLILYGAALNASDLTKLAAGTPVAQLGGLSATNTVTLAVQPLPQPQLSAVQYGNGRFQMTVTAYAGSGYTVQSSTNLTAWTTAFVTNAVPSGVFVFTDAAATNAPTKFYRVRSGP